MFGIASIYWVLIDSCIAFVYLFIISKLLGKKQIAQLEFIDYTIGISPRKWRPIPKRRFGTF